MSAVVCSNVFTVLAELPTESQDKPKALSIDNGPYLCCYASQAAACIGENKHKKICDAVQAFWERSDYQGFRIALHRNGILTEEEILEKARRQHPTIASLLRSASEIEETSTEVASKYSRLSNDFVEYANEHYMPEEVVRVVDDALRKTTYTTYGNTQESNVFDYINDMLQIKCTEDFTFYKAQAGTITNEHGTFPWFIGGKIDAINEDRTVLIEIKNRVNRLFRRLPSYEMIQVQTYLQLLGIDKAILVEAMKTKERNSTLDNVNVISVHKDEILWNFDILPRLEGVVDFVIRLIHDEKLQDKFLCSKKRSAIVSYHITSYVRKKREDKTKKQNSKLLSDE
jgi:hypothetical protein